MIMGISWRAGPNSAASLARWDSRASSSVLAPPMGSLRRGRPKPESSGRGVTSRGRVGCFRARGMSSGGAGSGRVPCAREGERTPSRCRNQKTRSTHERTSWDDKPCQVLGGAARADRTTTVKVANPAPDRLLFLAPATQHLRRRDCQPLVDRRNTHRPKPGLPRHRRQPRPPDRCILEPEEPVKRLTSVPHLIAPLHRRLGIESAYPGVQTA
jgi:hypothetical protein